MKKIAIILIFCFSFILGINSRTIEEELIDPGAWFLFSSRLEQQEGDTILTQVEFFKKDDVSSLLFENNNRLYSVFSDRESEMNEDLWKLLNDTSFVISDMTGKSLQVMDILELSKNKLILRYCDESDPNISKCVMSTYFSTKAGWLSDAEIDKLNSTGIIELEDSTP